MKHVALFVAAVFGATMASSQTYAEPVKVVLFGSVVATGVYGFWEVGRGRSTRERTVHPHGRRDARHGGPIMPLPSYGDKPRNLAPRAAHARGLPGSSVFDDFADLIFNCESSYF